VIALLLWMGMAWAEEYILEVGPVAERSEAADIASVAKAAGLPGRVVRRFRLGHGWEFIVIVEHMGSRQEAEKAAVRLGTDTRQPVTISVVGGEEVALPPEKPAATGSSTAAVVETVNAAHGGEAGGASALARAEVVHFVFDRTIRLNGKDVTFHHDYWREGGNRRLTVDGPETDSIAIAGASGAWLISGGKVHNRDVGVIINQVDAFAPEAVLAVVMDVWHLLRAPEVATFRVLEGAESGTRLGSGSSEEEPGVSFFDVDTDSKRLVRVRYVTDGGPVVYELQDYRVINEGLVVPFRVEVERGDGRRELISVKIVETAGRPPAGSFDKPGS
jgi:hypothetical protein